MTEVDLSLHGSAHKHVVEAHEADLVSHLSSVEMYDRVKDNGSSLKRGTQREAHARHAHDGERTMESARTIQEQRKAQRSSDREGRRVERISSSRLANFLYSSFCSNSGPRNTKQGLKPTVYERFPCNCYKPAQTVSGKLDKTPACMQARAARRGRSARGAAG